MGKHFEKNVSINFGRASKARKVKIRNKIRESNQEKGDILRTKRVKLCKKCLNYNHESENHTVVACRGMQSARQFLNMEDQSKEHRRNGKGTVTLAICYTVCLTWTNNLSL